eukprot:15333842-Ditylum_brightwellii.AAC.1
MMVSTLQIPKKFLTNLKQRATTPTTSKVLKIHNAQYQTVATSNALNNNDDVLIIGGGPMGLSTAYHLATLRSSGKGITILERDPTYKRASATLSAGGIRQ